MRELSSEAREETFEEVAADEALWDAQFAATEDDKLAALVTSVEAAINEGETLPMFDERGEFIEHLRGFGLAPMPSMTVSSSESASGFCGQMASGAFSPGMV